MGNKGDGDGCAGVLWKRRNCRPKPRWMDSIKDGEGIIRRRETRLPGLSEVTIVRDIGLHIKRDKTTRLVRGDYSPRHRPPHKEGQDY